MESQFSAQPPSSPTAARTEFGTLYDEYVKKIYNFIYYKVSSREVAEDLTSEVFFKALRSFRSFDPHKGTVGAWLYRIARNTVIDYYRTNKLTVDLEEVWETVLTEQNIKNIDCQISLAKIKDSLQQLTAEQREIIILRLWEELSYKEIAAIVGKSEANCKMIFSRSLNKLRGQLSLLTLILLLTSVANIWKIK